MPRARITGSSPKSPREFWQSPPSNTQSGLYFEEDGDWWASVGQFAATAALFITIAVAPNYHQDEVFPQFQPDEDYSLSQPIQVPISSRVAFSDDEIIVSSFDEDYWKAGSWFPQFQTFAYTDDEIIASQPFAYEDYWYQSMTWLGSFAPMAYSDDETWILFVPPPPSVQNYVNWGTNNFISQEIGGGVEY